MCWHDLLDSLYHFGRVKFVKISLSSCLFHWVVYFIELSISLSCLFHWVVYFIELSISSVELKINLNYKCNRTCRYAWGFRQTLVLIYVMLEWFEYQELPKNYFTVSRVHEIIESVSLLIRGLRARAQWDFVES